MSTRKIANHSAFAQKSEIPPTAAVGGLFRSFLKNNFSAFLIPPTAVGGYFTSSLRSDLNNPPTAVGGIQKLIIKFSD
jgi:hypothetical protein